MTAAASAAGSLPPKPRGFAGKLAWNWRHNPTFDLWFAWYAMVGFYNMFGIVFFIMTRTQPPPKAWWPAPRIVEWFTQYQWELLYGFGFTFLVIAFSITANALIAWTMRQMSVSRAFAYSYLIIYSMAGLPGMLLLCIALVTGAFRLDRDPEQISFLYDMAFLSFSGTMGIFLVGSLVWAIAILLDRNRVLPKWFGYFNICNALTEVVVATCVVYKVGPFAWNGSIAFNINMIVFGIYTGVFITLLKLLIERKEKALAEGTAL